MTNKLDITIDWIKPDPTTIGMGNRTETFTASRLYDLIDGMIAAARKTGEAEVKIRLLALNPETGTENALSAKSEEA